MSKHHHHGPHQSPDHVALAALTARVDAQAVEITAIKLQLSEAQAKLDALAQMVSRLDHRTVTTTILRT